MSQIPLLAIAHKDIPCTHEMGHLAPMPPSTLQTYQEPGSSIAIPQAQQAGQSHCSSCRGCVSSPEANGAVQRL